MSAEFVQATRRAQIFSVATPSNISVTVTGFRENATEWDAPRLFHIDAVNIIGDNAETE